MMIHFQTMTIHLKQQQKQKTKTPNTKCVPKHNLSCPDVGRGGRTAAAPTINNFVYKST